MSRTLDNCIDKKDLLKKIISVEDAVKLIPNKSVLAISGFTKSGEPKSFIPALGNFWSKTHPEFQITLLSGASLSEEVEKCIAPFVSKRAPYMSSIESRKRIIAHTMDYSDIHLSHFSRNLMYGFYGKIDFAVVEISKITEDGGIILTSSVGISFEALTKAKKIILEINTEGPDYSGFHDLILPQVFPHHGLPIPISDVSERAGSFQIKINWNKVVAIVESKQLDYGVTFKPTTEIDKKIAENIIGYLESCKKLYNWGDRLPPLQSGVGNIANAIVSELANSPFQKISFWTEVFQDGMLKFTEDEDKFDVASATALSFSNEGWLQFFNSFEKCKQRIILRPTWLSNAPEIISRLFVIAMNSCIEVDLYGHANSTHVDGSCIVNGLGGSGDFLRNSYLSIIHIPSVRKLKDGRVVSSIMPYVRHIDHTEHDIKCIVTEQGIMVNTDIISPIKRAQSIIENCAHPHFKPLLKEYLKLAGIGDEPRIGSMDIIKGWWEEYDYACKTFSKIAVLK